MLPRRPARAVRPPADVLARLDLARGERVLAAASAAEETWLLGTRLALHVVAPHGLIRIGWEQVENAGWDVDASMLEVSEVGEWEQVRPRHRFAVTDPGRLLELLRERVSASVLLQRRILVGEHRGFNINARRSPDDGSVRWYVEYDEGVDPEAVQEQAGAALADARAEVEA